MTNEVRELQMGRISLALLLCVAATGCERAERFSADAPAAAPAAQARTRTLAYEHFVGLDVAEDRVQPIHASVEAACLKAVAEQCVILASNLNTGRHVSADIRVRAKPEGIRALIAGLSTEGKVVSQSVTAEDLAQPLADTATKLAMLGDYRSKLQSLSNKAAGNVDSLIKVSKELAEVQSQIEHLAGERAYLTRRVETEILNVSITSGSAGSFWRPIAQALSEFGAHLSTAIAGLVTALAYLLPWALLLSVLGWGSRKLWLRRKRRMQP